MTPAQLARVGKSLYGNRWKAPLARALGKDVTTVWRYATGQLEIPRLVEIALKSFLAARDK